MRKDDFALPASLAGARTGREEQRIMRETGLIPHRDIRQANDQLRLLCADRHQDASPVGSATVIVSPKPAIASEGVVSAESHVHVESSPVAAELARDTANAWDEVLASPRGALGRAARADRVRRDV